MRQLHITCLIFYFLSSTAYGSLSWSTSTTPLPTADYGMAVAYSRTTNLIWLLGGAANGYQVISFDPNQLNSSSSPFINNSINALSHQIFSYSHGYTQIEDILYMIDVSGTKLSIFNLASQEFIYNYDDTIIPHTVRNFACLTHIDHYLIITGGRDQSYTYLSNVQIYDLINKLWIVSAINMNTARAEHACIVNPNNKFLYVIGGRTSSGNFDTIYKLYVGDINNIDQYNWNDLDDKLSAPQYGLQAIMYQDDIFVIGGRTTPGAQVDRLSSDANIIRDTDLPEAVGYSSCIVANNKLFVLGGTDGSARDYIQYSIMPPTPKPTYQPTITTSYPTATPSVNPTFNPSSNPTFNPSFNPTFNPSSNPTFIPSTDPTFNPTTDPTFNPSAHPTFNPTFIPSTDPTLNPSTVPTFNPSTDPTIYPSSDPTFNPSFDPTIYPSADPSAELTTGPSTEPSADPTTELTDDPTTDGATTDPSIDPSAITTIDSTNNPTNTPHPEPTFHPSFSSITSTTSTSDTFGVKVSVSFDFNFNEDTSKPQLIAYFENVLNASLIHFIGSENECIDQAQNINITLNDDGSANINAFIPTCNKETETELVGYLNNGVDDLSTDIMKRSNENDEISIIDGSIAVSIDPVTDVEQVSDEEMQQESNIDSIYYILLLIILSISIIVGITGYIDAIFWRINDFFNVSAIFSVMLHVFDLISDIFLGINMSEKINQSVYFSLFVASLVFIVVPIILSITQLIHEINKHWSKDDKIKLWLSINANILYLLSVFTGSSFTAIELVNTNLFLLPSMSMDLSHEQITRYLGKRAYSIVLFENVPQVVIQFVYLINVDELNGIAISSMIFSIISILITIISIRTKKQMLDSQGYAIIHFDVTGSSIVIKTQMCRNKILKIKNQLSSLLGLDEQLVEIMRPQKIPNGLQMTVIIHVNRISVRNIDYEKLLNDAQQNGELKKIIMNGWDVNDDFICSTISFQIKESKQWIANTVPIKIKSVSYDDGLNIPIQDNEIEGLENNNEIEGYDNNLANIELAAMPEIHTQTTWRRDEEDGDSDKLSHDEKYISTSGKNIIGNENNILTNDDVDQIINRSNSDNDDHDIIKQVNNTSGIIVKYDINIENDEEVLGDGQVTTE